MTFDRIGTRQNETSRVLEEKRSRALARLLKKKGDVYKKSDTQWKRGSAAWAVMEPMQREL